MGVVAALTFRNPVEARPTTAAELSPAATVSTDVPNGVNRPISSSSPMSVHSERFTFTVNKPPVLEFTENGRLGGVFVCAGLTSLLPVAVTVHLPSAP